MRLASQVIKVSYPLSLKVSLWLMLNLLLLAALGIGFLVVQGGLGWDALVAGPSGDRLQELANVISGEVSAATGEARTAVVKRFGSAYAAEFYLFNIEEGQVAGPPVELPSEVTARTEFRLGRTGPGGAPVPGVFGPGGFGGREGWRSGRGDFDGPRRRDFFDKGGMPRDSFEKGPKESFDKGPREFPEKGFPEKGHGGPDTSRRDPPFKGGPASDVASRFVVRAGSPAAYWVGLRVPYTSPVHGRMIPAKLIVRVGSLWSLLHLLNLQSWVLAGTAVLALSVLFWLPLVRGISHSIRQLTRATEQIAEGNFETRVSTNRRDELGRLGDSVNRMATRLDTHMTGQKRFLGDVAHELCSPLARLQMATGILSDHAPDTLRDTVTDVREEVQQMSTLVNELLAFTKAGLRSREVVCRQVEVETLAREVLTREDTGRRVALSIPENVRVSADRDLLGRALGNLVRNALRYAGEAGPITITATRENEQIAIAVEDQGPGVPAADLDRLGEPFFRPELARTRDTGGVGLGLAIVRNSIAACGGDVRFSNRSPRGFRAEIRLAAA